LTPTLATGKQLVSVIKIEVMKTYYGYNFRHSVIIQSNIGGVVHFFSRTEEETEHLVKVDDSIVCIWKLKLK